METFFIDYQRLIMQAYEQQQANNTLPHGLMHLTPGNLKEECVKKCTREVSRRDQKVIRDFCGDLSESKSCQVILQRCDTDKFRPLVNYLRGKSDKTDEKNIELLAWLLDFPGRPWEIWKTISNGDGTKKVPMLDNTSETGETPVRVPDIKDNPPVVETGKPVENPIIPEKPTIQTLMDNRQEKESNQKQLGGKSAKTLAAAVMVSLVLGTSGMWWWKDKLTSGGCMYWHEDHYEPVACDQKIPYTTVIALDAEKLKHFRKITRPDTITYDAVGKVWYSKIKGKMEYYTWAGEHPEVFGNQLKPITPYIIRIHILSGGSQNNDTIVNTMKAVPTWYSFGSK
ncbi:hypothetical protein [Chitinophaga eiseniae]|uniref:Uncharacterized protein n=1 Tax=Chitinophaga eiseniae TaxID=634771 RepID=A0A847SQ75_9BACT|nr:hypothetical protein [Chitinophaga eiseniae]NLR81127.1 hypothetical protein [Chitinophaga eiseniae]